MAARVLFALSHAAAVLGAAVSHGGREDPPTVDEKGLFGPPFDIPLLNTETGDVVENIQMQLAVTPPEQHHGLMFVKSMPQETGMLFLYTHPSKRVLWMKNTYIPLDAAWFTGDGVLQEVHEMPPLDLTYRWSDRSDIVMGLEMNGGHFKRNGEKPGTLKLDMKALASALSDRGFDPAPFVGAGAAPQGSPFDEDKEDIEPQKPPSPAVASFLRLGRGQP